jgi:uncharacterized repeat protein (TIGR01451 family)
MPGGAKRVYTFTDTVGLNQPTGQARYQPIVRYRSSPTTFFNYPSDPSYLNVIDQYQISLVKTPNRTTANNGDEIIWTVALRSNGTDPTGTVRVQDGISGDILYASRSWSAVDSGFVSGLPNSGSGNIDQSLLSLPPGGERVYTIRDRISLSSGSGIARNQAVATYYSLSGELVKSVGATADVAVTALAPPNITVTKTSLSSQVLTGTTVVWTVTVANTGLLASPAFQFADPLSLFLGGVARSWSAIDTGFVSGLTNSGTGGIAQVIPSMPGGAQRIYTITDALPVTESGFVYDNTATATVPEDRDLLGYVASVTKTINTVSPAQVNSSMAASVESVKAGQSMAWYLRVSNLGGQDSGPTQIFNPMPSSPGNIVRTWVVNTPIAGVPTIGQGPVNFTVPSIPAGVGLTITITDAIPGTALPQTYTNSATISVQPNGGGQPVSYPISASTQITNASSDGLGGDPSEGGTNTGTGLDTASNAIYLPPGWLVNNGGLCGLLGMMDRNGFMLGSVNPGDFAPLYVETCQVELYSARAIATDAADYGSGVDTRTAWQSLPELAFSVPDLGCAAVFQVQVSMQSLSSVAANQSKFQARIVVDNIEQWVFNTGQAGTFQIELPAGTHSIKVEHHKNGGPGKLHAALLAWAKTAPTT